VTTLLEPHELAVLGPSASQILPIDLIDPNPLNPRKQLTEVDALADNIKQFGLLQPVIVRHTGERYELLGGHRRRAAVLLLRDREPHDPRWRVLDAVVRDADDDQSYLMLLSAQVHNRSWRPREEASALERLIIGRTLKQVGEALNRTESWASKRLRVYSDSVLSGYVQTGRLTATVAEEMLSILDSTIRQEIAERAVAEGWSQAHARNQVRALRLDRQLREVAKRARELLALLSSIDAGRLPREAKDDLMTLHRRIVALGRGPVLPTIEAAQKAAGVKTQERPKTGKRRPAGYRPGYKPKL
jgi:ParB family transcriptional regulator, chromosome partitioning protein